MYIGKNVRETMRLSLGRWGWKKEGKRKGKRGRERERERMRWGGKGGVQPWKRRGRKKIAS